MANLQLKYRIADYLLSYNRYREYAFRKKNKVSDNQYETGYKKVDLTADYLALLDQIHVNNETSLVANGYSTFVNRIMFMDGVFKHYNNQFTQYYIDAFKDVPPTTEEEKELLKSFTASLSDESIDLNSIFKNNKSAAERMIRDRQAYFDKPVKVDLSESRTTVLNDLVKTDLSFTLAIIKTQEQANEVVRELKPADMRALAAFKKKVSNPAIYKAFEVFNNGLKAKIEAMSKIKTGFVRNAMPKTTADSVFAAILKKYSGKAIYVDFWATWCGPCLRGIEEIAPLKKELKDENIAFVYITDPSSPEETYKKMIPGIPGEHYKLSKDEWNYIAGKYSISGIPRYMLADKDGNIVNDSFHGDSNASIKTELLKLAKKE